MEQVVKVARTLREVHGFRGYIHSQDDSGGGAGVDCGGGAVGGPHQHQCGAADAGGPGETGAGEKPGADSDDDGGDSRADHGGEGGAAREPEGAALLAGGAKHADDRGRDADAGPADFGAGILFIWRAQAAARLLFGI